MAAAAVEAQPASVRIYSEFTRIDPFGEIVAADRSPDGLPPREILSPAMVRNGHASFHVVVNVPAGEEFTLFALQNPFGALDLKLYKEKYEKRGEAWIPDLLRPLGQQYTGRLPDPAAHIDNQTHMAFLLDVFVPPKAMVRRYRVEAQLLVQGRYIIAPMEVRIANPVPKDGGPSLGGVSEVEAGTDAVAVSVLREQLCRPAASNGDAAEDEPKTVRSAILRNARQDMAVARALSAEKGRDVLAALFGLEKKEAWCEQPRMPGRERGAEWYLRVRDRLYRMGRESMVEAGPIDAAPELKVQ